MTATLRTRIPPRHADAVYRSRASARRAHERGATPLRRGTDCKVAGLLPRATFARHAQYEATPILTVAVARQGHRMLSLTPARARMPTDRLETRTWKPAPRRGQGVSPARACTACHDNIVRNDGASLKQSLFPFLAAVCRPHCTDVRECDCGSQPSNSLEGAEMDCASPCCPRTSDEDNSAREEK